MALKDLVVSHADLTEEQIEAIISPYVRYDPVAKSIVLLPSAAGLSNRQRVIVCLVALRGWPFVIADETPPTSAMPADLERCLQIPGGTLRPILKELEDSRLVEVTEGRYSVNPIAFPFLAEQLANGVVAESRAPHGPRSRQGKRGRGGVSTQDGVADSVPKPQGNAKSDAESAAPASPTRNALGQGSRRRGRRDATMAGRGPLARVRELIREGWFSVPRTTSEIVAELGARGATYRGQDLTRQMITLTRNQELRRKRMARPGSRRPVWHYQA